YGLILMPMGAVIFADFWLVPKLGLRQRYAEWRSLLVSWPAAVTWVVTLVACWAINAMWGLEIFFLGLPGWFIATVLYLGLGAFLIVPVALADSGERYVVDTRAGLTFGVNKANCDIVSLRYQGVELQDQSRFSHIGSGLGSSSTQVTAATSADGTVATVTCTT